MDLVVFYSPDKCCVTYYINNDSAGYKIEYPFSAIKNIILDNGDPHSNAEGAAQRPGGLIVELNRPPSFFMDSSGQGGFYQCGDFTEDQQASQVMVHHLGGHPKVLSGQLAKLIALESFQNRHHQFAEHAPLAVSAPVSPVMHRPASQPNHAVAHNPVNAFHDTPWGVGVGLAAPRGHKRQRSRSVPIAVDFSMLRNPIQPFFIPPPPPTAPLQPPQSLAPVPESAPYVHQPEIVAPVPQYHPAQGPLGPTLSIDTSAGYNMGMQAYPVSATTAPSPATDFGTPAFYSAGPQQEPMTASSLMPTPFAMQFTGVPDMQSRTPVPQPSVSPMPQYIPDPVIANQSPPLSSVGRSSSAEFFHMSHDGSIADDNMLLAELYSKQPVPMSLPFRPMEHEQYHPQQHGQHPTELDMAMMQVFGQPVDPQSMGQQHMGY